MPADVRLDGQCVLSIAIGRDLSRSVVDGLADLGAMVFRTGPKLDLSSRASVASGVDEAIRAHGLPDLVLLNVVPEVAMNPQPIAALPEGEWRSALMEGLRTTVRLLQALAPHVKSKGAAIVFVAPSLSLVGTPDMVALSALLEGQRGLMKSVARQWGGSGVTLNWIATAPRALAPFEGVALAAKPDAVSLALGRAPDPRSEIAPAVAFLASKAGRAMTGATLMLDGGEWMVP
ncbi:MAG TPA: SDR family oxidoreductase [Caulobacterales bacterium]|nr:SDR family oxidoreductase [Caulobacterales bacterium]